MPTSDIERLEAQDTTAEEPCRADPAIRALLLALVRQQTSAGTANIAQLAEKITYWELLLSLVEGHGILPLTYARLRESGAALPPAIETRLRAGYERNALQCMINAAELIAIQSAMNREKIPVFPYKGVALAASVYHDLTARPAGDLDLLVHRHHLAQASEVLFERGFKRLTPIHADGTPLISNLNEYQFERPSDGLQLELRWKLDLGHPGFTRDLSMEWMWPTRQIVNLAGAEIPSLSPEIMLLVLCMHGSKHGWPRLVWILDVGQLLLAFPTLNWEEVIREGKKLGLSRTLALGVLLAHRMASANVPESVLHRFTSDSTMLTLARQVEKGPFDPNSSGLTSRTGYWVELLEWSDRIRYFFSLESLRPNHVDRAALPLPKSLHALYYVIRPLRILRDRLTR
jgi:hypothetical protein